jgi:tetratricopeptide (TPR) repeat protein
MDEREQEFKFNKAMEYEKEGKLLHAIQIYSSLIDTESFRRDSSMQLHKIYEGMERIEHASRILAEYLAEFPDDHELKKYYSLFLIKHSLYEDAIDQLSSLSAAEIPEVKFLSGLTRFFMKEFEESAINLTDFINENKASEYSYDAYLYLAKAQLELNNIEKALEAARGADKIFSNNEELQLLLAKIYLLKGMNFHAFESVSKGLRINKESHQMNELAGRISFELGEYDKAENHLSKLIAAADQSDEVYTLLGLIYLKKLEYGKAEEMFSRALELNANNELALKNKKICTENIDKQNILS